MPHDAINRTSVIPGDVYIQTRFKPKPVYWGKRDYEVVRTVRPKSKKSPKYPGQPRPMLDWSASGCHLTADTYGSVFDNDGYFFTRYTGCVVSASDPYYFPATDYGLRTDVVNRALSHFVEREVQVNTALREMGATVKQVTDTTKQVSGQVRDIGHWLQDAVTKGHLSPARSARFWNTRIRNLKDTFFDIPSQYLGYIFGWAQMKDDMDATFDHLRDHRRYGGIAPGFYLKSRRELANTGIWGLTSVPGIAVECDVELKLTARASFRFELPDWAYDALPPVSAFSNFWEQTPYSFLINTFVPVGTWLQAVEACQLSPFFKEGCSVLKWEMSPVGYVRSMNPEFDVRSRVYGSQYSYSRVTYDSIYQAVTFPELRSPLNLDNAITSVSLLLQRIIPGAIHGR